MDKNNRKYAVVNIGSLKTKCLLGFFDKNDKFFPLHKSNNLTCFGCGMHENGGRILEKNIKETIKEVLRLKRIIEKNNCQEVRLFATHALRNAVNKQEVKSQIEKATGFKIEIIEPEEEGELYFQAVIRDFTSNDNYIVTDIGGGSVQILIGNKEKLLKNYSFQTGAQFLHETFVRDPHNPETLTKKEDLERIEKYLAEQYTALNGEIGLPLIYGSSNIIDLFKAIKIPLKPYKNSLPHPYKANVKDINDFVERIINFPYGKREEMYPFQEGYMWGIDKAFLNVITLSKKFNSPYIIPSNTSIMEGFLYRLKEEI